MKRSSVSCGDSPLHGARFRLILLAIALFSFMPARVAGGWDGPLGLKPDSSVTGSLPFDWTGHWGITHTYGFPGWGLDTQNDGILLDGNFAHWHRRYAFPFPQRLQPWEEEAGAQSAIWYRRGDYHLDEFAMDMAYGLTGGPTSRFQGMKRNFDDRYGLLGPTRFPGVGGTIEQNYRLMITMPDESNAEWRISTAYFKTTDSIPYPGGQ
ncbi:MAG: hypothetical protein ACE5HZ_09605, partial [Fidelibacterota bacterium]